MKSTRSHDPCAMCARFTTKGYAELAGKGRGYCSGYEREARPDGDPSVLFLPAPAGEVRARRAFLEKHREAA